MLTWFKDRLQNILQQLINSLPGNQIPSNNQNLNFQEEHPALPHPKGALPLHLQLWLKENKYPHRRIKSQATILLSKESLPKTVLGEEEEEEASGHRGEPFQTPKTTFHWPGTSLQHLFQSLSLYFHDVSGDPENHIHTYKTIMRLHRAIKLFCVWLFLLLWGKQPKIGSTACLMDRYLLSET